METKAVEATNNRLYEDFEPYCKWLTKEGQKILEIDLKGFKKEQLKVQTNNKGILKIYGEKSLGASSKKWSRFRKEIRISKDCDVNRIQAKFSQGILSIVIPKSEVIQHAKDATIGKHSFWGVQDRKRITIQIVIGAVALVALGTYVAQVVVVNKQHHDAFGKVNVVNV
ncbi:inactive protein RESTRICTED TEV MOVEMENT [Trifolium repens]|nr:inactive protein RESTRICTED TEV MOVEMENT [Trifolium repens]